MDNPWGIVLRHCDPTCRRGIHCLESLAGNSAKLCAGFGDVDHVVDRPPSDLEAILFIFTMRASTVLTIAVERPLATLRSRAVPHRLTRSLQGWQRKLGEVPLTLSAQRENRDSVIVHMGLSFIIINGRIIQRHPLSDPHSHLTLMEFSRGARPYCPRVERPSLSFRERISSKS
jgi:hypothetical protein